jgi:drug/metabolite transporter (DMT)-like permease
MHKENFKYSLSSAGLLIVTAIWGSTFFIVKDTLNSINPIALVTYRFGIATAIFAGLICLKQGKFWSQFRYGFVLGCLLWLQYTFQTIGLQYTTASSSGFITGLFVIFVPLFGPLFFGKKPTLMQTLALFVALIGLWFLTGGLKSINYGDLLTLITTIAGAFYLLTVDKFVKENKSIFTLNFQQFFTAALLSLLTMLIFHTPISVESPKALVAILYLAIFANAVTYGLQFLCLKHVKPFTASLLLSMEPVCAALFAWTIGHEKFLFSEAIGGLFIIMSIVLSEINLNPIRKGWNENQDTDS